MPGIVALITTRPRSWAEAQLKLMLNSIQHELAYVDGVWADESLGTYIAWTAHKGSFSSRMPLFNEKRDVCLVLSGEEYSEPVLDNNNGQGRKPSSLANRYEDGLAFLASLNGIFHGCIADQRAGKTTVFNDRYGMHRLCYHEGKDAFYFATEAKAILAVLPELRVADPRSLGEFASLSCVLRDRTLFKDIQVLPAGSAWVFRGGSLDRKCRYFETKEWENLSPFDSETYYSELRQAFSKSLPAYFSGNERVGMTLTGGFDTRMIMAWHQSDPGSLPCYTFGGMFRESRDVRVARQIADICRQPYNVITVGNEFLSRFPHYAERTMYLTEGGVDLSRTSDLYVSEKAREIAPVKVVGTYGSEIVRQAVMFKPVPAPSGMFHPDFAANLRSAEETYKEVRREHPVTFAAFRQSPWYHQGVLALESSQLTVRSPYLDNEFVRAVFRSPKALNGDVRPRLIRDGNPVLGKIRTDRGAGGESSRALSLIARGVQEFTFKAEYEYDYGMPQWLARADHIFAPLHLERLFLGRHKLCHYRVWYRDALAGYVREILLDERALSRPYLERKGVEAIVKGHTKEGLNYTSSVHKLLSLELLHRIFLDSR